VLTVAPAGEVLVEIVGVSLPPAATTRKATTKPITRPSGMPITRLILWRRKLFTRPSSSPAG